jgi:hypothetical protein
MQFYVRARPVREGVSFLSKLGSGRENAVSFALSLLPALLAADSFTDDSIATPSFLAARGENKLL